MDDSLFLPNYYYYHELKLCLSHTYELITTYVINIKQCQQIPYRRGVYSDSKPIHLTRKLVSSIHTSSF